VFIEGAMSFLGLGVRPPQPSLGSLIRDGVRNMYDAPYFAVGPLAIVVALVLGLLLISQALAEARRA
jgi:peptide/nickel transport system permease protein